MSTGLLANIIATKNKKKEERVTLSDESEASRFNFHADTVISLFLLLPQG